MKKIKKAFVYGLIVTLVINSFGFFIGTINSSLESMIVEFKRVSPISISIFFVPAFLSVMFYKEDVFKNGFKGAKHFLILILISSGLVYLIVYFSLLPNAKPTHRGIYRVTFFNTLLSIVVLVFSFLIIYLKNTHSLKTQKYLNIRPSFYKVSLFFIIIFLAYSSLFFAFGNSSWLKFKFFYNLFVNGLLITLFSYFSFRQIYLKQKGKYWIILIYVINILVIPFLLLMVNSDTSFEFFLKKLKVYFSLISPYYLMLTLAVHTYFIYLINKQEKLNLKQIGTEASLKYQQLKAQISPHFLFNNINVLTSLIEENPEKAVAFSQNLSGIYRYFLDQEKQDLVLLQEELSFAEEYLNLLKVRYENAITIIDKTKETENYYILPLALQQVLENIIKHNEISIETQITITLTTQEDYLIVSNNLNPKISQEKTKQTGIESMRNRYAYFTEQRIIINQETQNYTIKLPLLKIED